MDEIWKDIGGYEGVYQVSNLGRIRSLDRSRVVKDSHGGYMTRTDKGRVMRHTDNGHGYLMIALASGSNRKNKYVHRLVAAAFCENPENKPDVNHKDYDRRNNRADNLEWVSTKENITYSAHRMRKPKEHSRTGETGYKYISKAKNHGIPCYRVSIKQAHVCKCFGNLADAVEYRNEVMQVWRISAFCAEEMA